MLACFFSMSAEAESGAKKEENDLIIYPVPRNISYEQGVYNLKSAKVWANDAVSDFTLEKLADDLMKYTKLTMDAAEEKADISFTQDESLHSEGYSLKIDGSGVQIRHRDSAGALYAEVTLKQIIQQKGTKLPYLTIENDHPDLAGRMFFLDISRNRIPTMETLKTLLDDMLDMKLNQFEMYIEGFPFAYESYPEAWENCTPITPQQMRELTEYAKLRGIEIIPNQNTFGHMTRWTQLAQFASLSERPEIQGCSTFNLFNPDTVEFLEKTFDDLLPCFDSKYFHINCDEPHEVGTGESARLYPEKTKAQLYLEQVKIIYDLVVARGYIPIVASDMINNYYDEDPEIIEKITTVMPQLVIADWGYMTDRNWSVTTERFKENGIKFFVQPACWSWGTIIGRTSFAETNIEQTIYWGIENGAQGVMVSDFGDWGNHNHLVASYGGMTYGAGLSWCYENNLKTEFDYNEYLSKLVYQDEMGVISQLYTTLADYNAYYTQSWAVSWVVGLMKEKYTQTDGSDMEFMLTRESGATLQERAESALARLERTVDEADAFMDAVENMKLNGAQGEYVRREMYNGAWMLRCGALYGAMRIRLYTGLTDYSGEYEAAKLLYNDFKAFLEDFKQVWLLRNRYSDLDDTLLAISHPLGLYIDIAPELVGINGKELCPVQLPYPLTAQDMTMGYCWGIYGSCEPKLCTEFLGGNYARVKSAIADEVYFTVKDMAGADGTVLAYSEKRAVELGYTTTDKAKAPTFVSVPLYFPEDGLYEMTMKAKLSDGNVIGNGALSIRGTALREKNGTLMDVNGFDVECSEQDESGWQNVKVKFLVMDGEYKYASVTVKAPNTQSEYLYITEMHMEKYVPPAKATPTQMPEATETPTEAPQLAVPSDKTEKSLLSIPKTIAAGALAVGALAAIATLIFKRKKK